MVTCRLSADAKARYMLVDNGLVIDGAFCKFCHLC